MEMYNKEKELYTRKKSPVIYIHHGASHFDPSKFTTVRNRPNWIKPMGHTGLWASPVGAERGWKDWCENEHYMEELLEEHFLFEARDPGRIFFVDSAPAYETLVERYGVKNEFGSPYYNPWYIDFEKMASDGWDGLEISIAEYFRLYDLMYGWDCDSVIIFRREAIKEIEIKEDIDNGLFEAVPDSEEGAFMGDFSFQEWGDSICGDKLF